MNEEKWKGPKDYLGQIKDLDNLITTNLESISTLKARLFSTSVELKQDKPQGTGTNFDFTEIIAKIDGIEREVDREVDRLIALRKSIEDEIKTLDSNIQVLVLINFYVIGKSLIEISTEYNYGPSYIKHVHGWALEAFKEKFPEKFE